MRAIVTGGTGFLGSHLIRALLDRQDAVAVVIRPQSNTWRIRDVADRLVVLECPSTDLVTRSVAFRPDALFHLAWAGVHGANRADTRNLADNLRHTVEVVELAAAAGCGTIVGIGSQAELGPTAEVIDESTPARPDTAYGIGKLAAGLVLEHTSAALGMRGVWLRLLSAYGPMDEPSYLIPYIIREMVAGRRPKLSAGSQPHDTLYCRDVVEALRAAAVSGSCAGRYVLAAGGDMTVRDVAEAVREIVAPALALDLGQPAAHPGWRGSHRKLTEDTGWSPSTALHAGLAETVLWYREHGDHP